MNRKIKRLWFALGILTLAAALIVPVTRNYARANQTINTATRATPLYTDNATATDTPGNTTSSSGTFGPQDFRNYMYGMMNWMMGPYWSGSQGGADNSPQSATPYWGMMGGYRGYQGQTGGTTPSTGATNSQSQGQQSSVGKSATLELNIYPDSKLGPDGRKHDAYIPADFTLKQGTPVQVTILNYDTMPHSFTAISLGLNIQAAPASPNGSPGVTHFAFTPTQAGDFTWLCLDPCDLQANGWAMSHDGYMRGTIRVQS